MKPTDYKLISELTAKMAEGEFLEVRQRDPATYEWMAWQPTILEMVLPNIQSTNKQFRTRPAEPAACCEDWEDNIDKINAPFLLQAARTGNPNQYTGVQFRYCPWCSKPRPQEAPKNQGGNQSSQTEQLPPSVPVETHPKHELCVDCGEVSTTGRDENGKPLCCGCRQIRTEPREWWLVSQTNRKMPWMVYTKKPVFTKPETREIIHVQEVK
jgi:hypothetical protein